MALAMLVAAAARPTIQDAAERKTVTVAPVPSPGAGHRVTLLTAMAHVKLVGCSLTQAHPPAPTDRDWMEHPTLRPRLDFLILDVYSPGAQRAHSLWRISVGRDIPLDGVSAESYSALLTESLSFTAVLGAEYLIVAHADSQGGEPVVEIIPYEIGARGPFLRSHAAEARQAIEHRMNLPGMREQLARANKLLAELASIAEPKKDPANQNRIHEFRHLREGIRWSLAGQSEMRELATVLSDGLGPEGAKERELLHRLMEPTFEIERDLIEAAASLSEALARIES